MRVPCAAVENDDLHTEPSAPEFSDHV